jgi:hypothetical protein
MGVITTFRSAIRLFLAWVANPTSWNSTKKSRKDAQSKLDEKQILQENSDDREISTPQEKSDSIKRQFMEYPFPISTGIFANLKLPQDLTSTEAERVKRYLDLLVTTPHKSL